MSKQLPQGRISKHLTLLVGNLEKLMERPPRSCEALDTQHMFSDAVIGVALAVVCEALPQNSSLLSSAWWSYAGRCGPVAWSASRRQPMSKTPYPRNWKRASRTIRRVVGYCERCGATSVPLSVHHVGAPFADGRPGNPHDKRDLRRENLQVLCDPCHWIVDLPLWIRHLRREQKRERHAALGVGTGVVLYH